jgi:hypothetical protein
MTDLVIQFVCKDAGMRAEEFQHHLINRKIVKAGVQPETKGSETWLRFPNVQSGTIERIVREAHPWCLDRALSLMRGSGEGETSQATELLIADLARVLE